MPKAVTDIPGRQRGIKSVYRELLESLPPGLWELTEEDIPKGVKRTAFSASVTSFSLDYPHITAYKRGGRLFVEVVDADAA